MNNRVAIYCRLSQEDRDKKFKEDDSESIVNQKLMLADYAKNKNWIICKIYSDDDYSGSDRNRPAFCELIRDAKEKKFDIVLCKTQSRFTRELELVEKYINGLFPVWGIRFVSIVDNVDTDVRQNKKARQINGLVNEWYLEDMSDSIKAALTARMKAGYFIGSMPPYGYDKDPNNKGKLIINDDEAKIVKEIFELYLEGNGKTKIARILNERGIPNPSHSKLQRGVKIGLSHKGSSHLWRYSTITNILNNEVYIGNLVQARTYNPTYKSHRSVPSPKEHWIRVENTHEPIIDYGTWSRVRNECLSKATEQSTKKQTGYNSEHIFSRKVYCKYCNSVCRVAYTRKIRYYRCSTKLYDTNECRGVTVFESTLKKIVLNELNKIKDKYFDKQQFNQIKLRSLLEDKLKKAERELSSVESKIAENSLVIKNIYIDKLRNIISEEQFLDLSNQFSIESQKLLNDKTRIMNNISQIEYEKEKSKNVEDILQECLEITDLSPSLVEKMIDKIYISGCKQDRKIDILWNI